MRDLNTLLNSLVNVDRKSLIAILMSEAEKAEHQVRYSRHRTGAQLEGLIASANCDAMTHALQPERCYNFKPGTHSER